jgi:acyl-coenzyme A synthetase/AMP-(fatty) acid ligase
LEVDAVLLSHPAVSEAVAFAAPDEHFGEEVIMLTYYRQEVVISKEEYFVAFL